MKTVFRNGEVGYGSAMAVVLTVIVLGVGLAYSRIARRRSRPAVAGTRPGRSARAVALLRPEVGAAETSMTTPAACRGSS